jgi:hypothetical protein
VPSQARRGLDHAPGDPRSDTTAPQRPAAGREVVALMSM